jgi:hypothetical protein
MWEVESDRLKFIYFLFFLYFRVNMAHPEAQRGGQYLDYTLINESKFCLIV